MIKALALDGFWPQVFSKSKTKVSYSNPRELAGGFKLALGLGLLGLCGLVLMSYIYGVNEYANKGYEIKALQQKLAVLNDDNKKISLKISEATSMVVIQTDFLNANFVSAGTPKFLQVNQFSER